MYYIFRYLQQGTLNRATGATDMNEKSSRSHAILSVTLKQEKWAPSGSKSDSRPGSRLGAQKPAAAASGEDGDWVITTSKFHFVDLAGSERVSQKEYSSFCLQSKRYLSFIAQLYS